MNTDKSFKFLMFLQVFINLPIVYFFGINDFFILSVIASIVTFGLPIVFYLLYYKENPIYALNIHKISIRHIFFTIVCTYMFLPVGNFLSQLSSLFFENNVATYMETIIDLPFWKSLLILAILPAFFEELIMRGIFLSNFKKYPIFIVAILNGLFFSMIHFDFQQMGYAFVFGVYLTYLVYYTGSVFAGMIAHFIFNSSSVVSIYSLKYLEEANLSPISLTDAMNSPITSQDIVFAFVYATILGILGYGIFKKQFIEKPNLLYEPIVTNNKNCKPIFDKWFYANIITYIIFMTAYVLVY